MEDRILQIVLKAKDEASGEIEKVGKSAGGVAELLGKSFKNAAIISGVALGALVAESIKAVGAFAEAEAAQRQLEHAVIGVTGATQEQLRATMALADALEAKGVLDGDNIKVGLAQLSTFGLSNKAVQGLGGSLADLAVNQFGVNASGEQLTQTANMIAKALKGQFGVLEKSGIRFTEAQQSIIKFGSEMEKVKAINEGFAQNLKYTNDVALSTFEGKMAAIKVKVGNLEEAFGGFIANALSPLMGNLNMFLENITPWLTGLEGVDTMASRMAEDFGMFGEVFGTVVKFFAENKIALEALAGVLGGVLAISLVAAAGAMLAFIGVSLPMLAAGAAIGAVAALIITNWSSVVSFLQPVLDFFVGMFGTLKAQFDEFALANAPAFMAAWDTIKNVIGAGLLIIQNVWNAVWPALQQVFNGVWNMIKGILQVAWGIIQLAITVGLAMISGDWSKAWTGIKVAFQDIWNGLVTFLTGIWESIKGIFRGGINAIIGMLNGFIDIINKAGAVAGVKVAKLPSFDNGGWVPQDMVAVVHRGEFVMSKDMLSGREPVPFTTNNNYGGAISLGPIYVQDVSDIDLLSQRLAFALNTNGNL
jgi:hypothetical protein